MKNKVTITTISPAETIALGKKISRLLNPGDIICLSGNLGSGKTTLAKGIAKGLSIDPVKVNSPTFVILNAYEGRLSLYHFDLYRLNKMQEMGVIGYDEFLYGEGVSLIEWGERLENLLPKEFLNVKIVQSGVSKRDFCFKAVGKKYKSMVDQMARIKK